MISGGSFRARLELSKARLFVSCVYRLSFYFDFVIPISHEPARDISSSLPARGSLRNAELAGDDVLDGVVDIGEVVERLEGNLLVLAERDKI